MPTPTEITDHLDRLLGVRDFRDYCPNGLQVPATGAVQTVVTGVSAHLDLLSRAVAAEAGLVLVHHGLFWRGDPLEITAVKYRRLKLLFDHDIALAAYHLPLDAHPEHGNNALIAEALGLTDRAPLGGIGIQGTLPGPESLPSFARRLGEVLGGRRPLELAGGDHAVRRVG